MSIIKKILKKEEDKERQSEEKEEKKKIIEAEKKKKIEVKEKIKPEKVEGKTKISKKEPYPFIDKILLAPVITEKASRLASQNQYVFKVGRTANKTEIKRAVEQTFGVEVIKVRIVKMPAKKKRIGRILEGEKKGYKKAIVRIKEGQSIEILPR